MQIETQIDLDQALRADLFLLLKHSNRCSVSSRAFREYEAFLESHEIATGWIDVVANRELSLAFAERTGIAHESPQALLLKQGAVTWHTSHFDITQENLARAL